MSSPTMVRLRDLGKWSGGNTPSKAKPEYWSNGSIPWVSPKDMKVEEIASSEDQISALALEEGRLSLVREGSVLFVTRSGILSHTFPVATTKIPVTINQDIKALTPKPHVLPKYVAHAIRGAGQRVLKECSKHGTTVASIETNALLDFEIPMVEIERQHEIVAELEKQFSRLDEAVANLKRVKAHLARQNESLLQHAVVDGAGLPGSKPLPPGWQQVSIGQLLRERMVNGLSIKESPVPTAVRALRLSAMTQDGFDYRDHRFLPVTPDVVADIVVQQGDFFVSRGNGSLHLVGRGVIAQESPFPVVFPDTMIRLRFIDPSVAQWVQMLWPSRLIRRQIEQRVKTTAGIYKISQPQLASITLPLPPPKERERIRVWVDRNLTSFRAVEAEVVANIRRAQALRVAVLSSFFSNV